MALLRSPRPDGRLPASNVNITLLAMPTSPRQTPAALATTAIFMIGSSSSAGAQSPQGPHYPSAPSPYTAPAPPPLVAGGLRPPAAVAPEPGESETIRRLERAEREDAGRGLEFFWVDLDAGYQYVSLQAFHDDGLLDGDLMKDSGSGLAVGVGAGVRLIFVTLGARLRLAELGDYRLWTLGGELGLHLPMGALEPSFTFGVGYAALGTPSSDARDDFAADQVDVDGVDARLGANLDYYVNPLLSVGARGTFEALALWRSGVDQPLAPADGAPAPEVYGRDGSGIGLGVTLSAAVGLHF
jgi:hypothetical protein